MNPIIPGFIMIVGGLLLCLLGLWFPRHRLTPKTIADTEIRSRGELLFTVKGGSETIILAPGVTMEKVCAELSRAVQR